MSVDQLKETKARSWEQRTLTSMSVFSVLTTDLSPSQLPGPPSSSPSFSLASPSMSLRPLNGRPQLEMANPTQPGTLLSEKEGMWRKGR